MDDALINTGGKMNEDPIGRPADHQDERLPEQQEFTKDEWYLIDAAIELINDPESGIRTEETVKAWLEDWFKIAAAVNNEQEVDRNRVTNAVLQYLNSLEM